MSLKHSLIALTLISVVADTMLLPFYPQFFSQAFGVDSAQHVGFYIAACCLTVMIALPVWAIIARHVNELHLWVYSQIAAAILGIYCAQTESLVGFWLASQLMLVFKASYLLIYPYVMRLEESDQHLHVVGLFSVLMHFGAIGGALLGGAILEILQAQDVYYLMAASDILQVIICLNLIRLLKTPFKPILVKHSDAAVNRSQPTPEAFFSANNIIFRLSLISMLFYFSAFLIRPFFAAYWQTISRLDSEIISAAVYSIPAWVALFCLWRNTQKPSQKSHFNAIFFGALIGILGLILQGSTDGTTVVIGRALFGYAMFNITVRLEVLLFENSAQQDYGDNFSRVHFFQNLGVIVASLSVGYLVDKTDIQSVFELAAVAFTLTGICFYLLFKPRVEQRAAPTNAIDYKD
jgi:MFS family permease